MGVAIIKVLHKDVIIAALFITSEELDTFEHSS